MAEREHVNESIKYHIELLRLVWISLLALGGGVIGLLTAVIFTTTSAKIILIACGAVAVVALSAWAAYLDKRIRALIAALKEVRE